MGASSSDPKTEILFSAYKSFENNINYMKECKKLAKEVYLINAKTIPNFISIIKRYYGNEEKLKKHLADYELEKGIKVYSSYKECIDVANNKEENEFIIVDKEFIEKMNIKDSYPVNLEVDGGKSKITFPVSQFLINIKQKDNELGIYEFFIDNDEFNPSTIIKIQNNENNQPKISQTCNKLNNNNNLFNDFNNNFNNNFYNNNINLPVHNIFKSSMNNQFNNNMLYANNY